LISGEPGIGKSRISQTVLEQISARPHTRLGYFCSPHQPVLMAWEDVHWSDPSTLESLDLLVDRVPALRLLVIITFRPEFAPPWVGRPHVIMLILNRLPDRQAR